MKIKIVFAISCTALVALATLALLASEENGIVLSHDGKQIIATKAPSQITPSNHEAAKLKTIAGNLSTYPFGTFFCCLGYTVSGSNYLFQSRHAVAFTPAANAIVTRVEASVGRVGTSGFELSLNEDSNGVPGKALTTFHFANPPNFGFCCALDVGKSNGIAVTAGTQYWLVASTTSKDTNFLGGWAFNSTDMRLHLIAVWCKGPTKYCGENSGKWSSGLGLQQGFAVLGQ